MSWKKLFLPLTLSTILSACGGSSSSSPPGNSSEAASSSSIDTSTPFACNPEIYDKAMELRIYQVMVESFINGDPTIGYATGYGTSHHHGDIQGIIDSLPYISEMGFNALWMTPVFASVPTPGQDAFADRLDATGYYASDFFAVDPNFGTLDELRELVETAHELGLYVFFDGVFGHFKNNAHNYPSPEGLNLSTTGTTIGAVGREAVYPSDLAFFQEVASYWITELKIDGWRLDQAYQVPPDAWAKIRNTVEQASASVTYVNHQGETVNPLGYMVAEVWDSANTIAETAYGSAEHPALCSAFDFPLRYALTRTLAVEENGTGNPVAAGLNAGFATHFSYPEHAVPNGFIGNHDLVRFGDLLQRGNIAEPDEDAYWLRHKAAFSFLTAYSGPVTFYYGEEIGQEVPGFAQQVINNCAELGLCDDHVARDSGKIEGLPTGIDGDIFSANSREADLRDYLKNLLHLRAENPALYKGQRTAITAPLEQIDSVYIDHKAHEDSAIVYVLNLSDQAQTLVLPACTLGSEGTLENLLTSDLYTPNEDANYTLSLSPISGSFLKITSPSDHGPGCENDSAPVPSGPLADCHLPDVDGLQPLGQPIYIRGSYAGGSDFGATPENRRFAYKGDSLYQVIVNEPSATTYAFKFATADWINEYAVAGGAPVVMGNEQILSIASGPGTESTVSIPSPGNYLFSFQLNANLNGGTLMVSECQ